MYQQILVSMPVLLLYEMGIWIARRQANDGPADAPRSPFGCVCGQGLEPPKRRCLDASLTGKPVKPFPLST